MRRHLVFTLAAPLGRFGPPTVSSSNVKRTPTLLEPPKSAILGLQTAAAGLPRKHIVTYTDGLLVAIKTLCQPIPWSQPDYQTVTAAPKGFAGKTLGKHTRFDELRDHLAGNDQRGSLLSWREYWSAGFW